MHLRIIPLSRFTLHQSPLLPSVCIDYYPSLFSRRCVADSLWLVDLCINGFISVAEVGPPMTCNGEFIYLISLSFTLRVYRLARMVENSALHKQGRKCTKTVKLRYTAWFRRISSVREKPVIEKWGNSHSQPQISYPVFAFALKPNFAQICSSLVHFRMQKAC